MYNAVVPAPAVIPYLVCANECCTRKTTTGTINIFLNTPFKKGCLNILVTAF